MNIYRIRCDVNKYQSFLLENPDGWSLEDMSFDGNQRLESWISPDVYILHPKLKQGNIFNFDHGTGTFITDAHATEILADLLEMSGELLPLSYNDANFNIVNVTEVVDVLDEDRTEWVYEKGNGPVSSYAFHANRLPDAPLFKIPQENSVDIFTVEGMKDAYDEFKGRVEQSGLMGLTFEKVWSQE